MSNWFEASFVHARIFVVDDNLENLAVAHSLLEVAGYTNVVDIQNPQEVVHRIVSESPDLVLLDLRMPEVSGFMILEKLREVMPPDAFVPVLVVTADASIVAKRRALDLGAHDFITKPFEGIELLLRVRNFLQMRQMHRALCDENVALEERVRFRTLEMQEARAEGLICLARALEYRDDATGEHTRRVGDLSGDLAEAMGLGDEAVELIRLAAPLHDLGKIGVPDQILLKPGKLDPDEWVCMQTHARLGATIVGQCKSPVLQLVSEISMHHHERWDGSGYPEGLRGEQIPLSCRIIGVVDTYDALLTERPYKKAWTRRDALAEIQRQSGRHFDPAVVEAFLKLCG